MVSHSRETTSGYRCWRHTKKLRVGTGNCKDKKAEEWKWQKQQRWVMRSFQRLDVVFKCHPLSSDCFLWMRVFQCHSVWETISPFFFFFFFCLLSPFKIVGSFHTKKTFYWRTWTLWFVFIKNHKQQTIFVNHRPQCGPVVMLWRYSSRVRWSGITHGLYQEQGE